MPVPKTNLFKGDRVRLVPAYFARQKLRNSHAPTGRWDNRVGTIVSDTLDPSYNVIIVHWDGCVYPVLRKNRGYSPEDLVLVEDDNPTAQQVGSQQEGPPDAHV